MRGSFHSTNAQVFGACAGANGRCQAEIESARSGDGLSRERLVRVGHIVVTIPVHKDIHAGGAAAQRSGGDGHGHRECGGGTQDHRRHGQVFVIHRIVVPGSSAVGGTHRFSICGEGANADDAVGRLGRQGEATVVAVVHGIHARIQVADGVARQHGEDSGSSRADVRIAVQRVTAPGIRRAEAIACRADELDAVIPRCHSGEAVVATAVRDRGRHGGQVRRIQQLHQHTADAAFARVFHSILVDIIPYQIADHTGIGRIVTERIVAHAEELAVRPVDAEPETKDRAGGAKEGLPHHGQVVALAALVGGRSIARVPVMRAAHLHRARARDHVARGIQRLQLHVGVAEALLNHNVVLGGEAVAEADVIFPGVVRLSLATIVEDVVVEIGVRRDLGGGGGEAHRAAGGDAGGRAIEQHTEGAVGGRNRDIGDATAVEVGHVQSLVGSAVLNREREQFNDRVGGGADTGGLRGLARGGAIHPVAGRSNRHVVGARSTHHLHHRTRADDLHRVAACDLASCGIRGLHREGRRLVRGRRAAQNASGGMQGQPRRQCACDGAEGVGRAAPERCDRHRISRPACGDGQLRDCWTNDDLGAQPHHIILGLTSRAAAHRRGRRIVSHAETHAALRANAGRGRHGEPDIDRLKRGIGRQGRVVNTLPTGRKIDIVECAIVVKIDPALQVAADGVIVEYGDRHRHRLATRDHGWQRDPILIHTVSAGIGIGCYRSFRIHGSPEPEIAIDQVARCRRGSPAAIPVAEVKAGARRDRVTGRHADTAIGVGRFQGEGGRRGARRCASQQTSGGRERRPGWQAAAVQCEGIRRGASRSGGRLCISRAHRCIHTGQADGQRAATDHHGVAGVLDAAQRVSGADGEAAGLQRRRRAAHCGGGGGDTAGQNQSRRQAAAHHIPGVRRRASAGCERASAIGRIPLHRGRQGTTDRDGWASRINGVANGTDTACGIRRFDIERETAAAWRRARRHARRAIQRQPSGQRRRRHVGQRRRRRASLGQGHGPRAAHRRHGRRYRA